MLGKYRDGVVPAAGQTALDEAGRGAVARYAAALDALDIKGAAEAAWDLVSTANLYIQQTAPWSLAKQGREAELDAALAALAGCLYRLAVLGSPFIPGKAQALWEALGQAGNCAAADWGALESPDLAGAPTAKPENLFPRPA